MSGGEVILIDDDEDVRTSIAQTLELRGFDTSVFARAETALDKIGPGYGGVVVCDVKMPRMDGMAFLAAAMARDPDLPIVLITGHGDVPLAVEALRNGAYDFIEKPFAQDRLVGAVERALDRRRMTLQMRDMGPPADDGDRLSGMVLGQSPRIQEIRRKVRTIADSRLDVLIVGATGTGKEHVARAIHALSEAPHKPFAAVNLAALPMDQVESELFGHTAGAFAGAARARIGRLEHGRGGTIFLDEVSSAPMALQAKLLRVIEDRSVVPLGAAEAVPLEARFVASSRVPLEDLVAQGTFRDDLMYRLNPVTITMPDLSDRRGDIPRLFATFVAEAAAKLDRPAPDLSAEILLRVAERPWPGNMRELRNAADLFVLGLEETGETAGPATTLSARVDAYERDVIASTLSIHGGSMKATYESLGIGRKTLYEKLQKHGIRREDPGTSD